MSLQSLSPRELDVMRLIVAGHTTKGAARHMGISVETAKDYTSRVRLKTGSATTAQAAVRVALLDKQ